MCCNKVLNGNSKTIFYLNDRQQRYKLLDKYGLGHLFKQYSTFERCLNKMLIQSRRNENKSMRRRFECLFEKKLYNKTEDIILHLMSYRKKPKNYRMKELYSIFMIRNPQYFIHISDDEKDIVDINTKFNVYNIENWLAFEKTLLDILDNESNNKFPDIESAIKFYQKRPRFYFVKEFHSLFTNKYYKAFFKKMNGVTRVAGKLVIDENIIMDDTFKIYKDNNYQYAITRYKREHITIKKGIYTFFGLYRDKRVLIRNIVWSTLNEEET